MGRDAAFAMLLALAWLTMTRGALAVAGVLPATCGRCGRRYERRQLGEPVCACHRAEALL